MDFKDQIVLRNRKQFYLIIKLLTCLILFTPFANAKSDTVITRYEILGSNKDGTIAAFTLTHFGPSSWAPFATLVIKKANEPEALFEDTVSSYQGGEKELKELVRILIKKNAEILNRFEIKGSNKMSQAHFIIKSSAPKQLLSGFINTDFITMLELLIKPSQSENCPNDPEVIDLEFWIDGVKRFASKQTPETCWGDDFSVRNIYLTQNALWIILNKHVSVFNTIDYYPIQIEGVTIK